ncbi:MAG: aspartate/aromatic aminotransferase, partial [Firmicutes bacterium]|nr:aspartate/aromatic aminotransferase [Bacillota bacterium]
KSCPFDSGFFITIPFESAEFAEAVGKELQKSEVFAVVLGAGVRVSIASLSEEKCAKVPELIVKAAEAVRG